MEAKAVPIIIVATGTVATDCVGASSFPTIPPIVIDMTVEDMTSAWAIAKSGTVLFFLTTTKDIQCGSV
ncbi:hypothetical protein LMG26686_00984 [Achromobacter mucicolens]|nr:hypothetical protein LMG26686_00984 [Achromobacter mucicolens]